jgi:hypothetical protein
MSFLVYKTRVAKKTSHTLDRIESWSLELEEGLEGCAVAVNRDGGVVRIRQTANGLEASGG